MFNVTLFCYGCDHPTCRLGDIIHENNKVGCVRRVGEDLYIRYYHQVKEVWPMISNENINIINKEYINTINVLNEVYMQPIVKQYGKGFKPQLLKE